MQEVFAVLTPRPALDVANPWESIESPLGCWKGKPVDDGMGARPKGGQERGCRCHPKPRTAPSRPARLGAGYGAVVGGESSPPSNGATVDEVLVTTGGAVVGGAEVSEGGAVVGTGATYGGGTSPGLAIT